jgi:hypothetical protein
VRLTYGCRAPLCAPAAGQVRASPGSAPLSTTSTCHCSYELSGQSISILHPATLVGTVLAPFSRPLHVHTLLPAHLDIHSSERRLYRLQHLLHHIIRAHPVQYSLHGIQRAAPLHAPLVLWRRNDDTMGVDLPRGQSNQRRRYVVNVMEGSKHTTTSALHIGRDHGSAYCAKMLKCRVAIAEMPPATALCSLMNTMMLWRYARTSELILTSATRFDNNLRSWNMVSTWYRVHNNSHSYGS